MKKQLGRVLSLVIALGVAPSMALAQSVGGAGAGGSVGGVGAGGSVGGVGAGQLSPTGAGAIGSVPSTGSTASPGVGATNAGGSFGQTSSYGANTTPGSTSSFSGTNGSYRGVTTGGVGPSTTNLLNSMGTTGGSFGGGNSVPGATGAGVNAGATTPTPISSGFEGLGH